MEKKELLEGEKPYFTKLSESAEELIEAINPETGEILDVVPLIELDSDENTVEGLLQEYTEKDLEISKLIIAQEEFRKANSKIFDEFEKYNKQIEQIQEQQEAIQGDLKNKMREENRKEVVGIRFTAKYTAPYTRKKFDTDKFYEDYSEETAMYKKYVSTTNVSESIKITENKKKKK